MSKKTPDLISHYRESLEKRRRLFYQYTHLPSLPRDATRKFNSKGEVKQFEGWSIVHFLSPDHEVFSKLNNLTRKFNNSLQASGIASKFAFLPSQTYHLTLVGIATEQSDDMGREITARIKACFEAFNNRKTPAPRVVIRGDIGPDGSTIIAPIEPLDLESLDTLYSIRNEVRESLHPLGNRIVPNRPRNFHGHISLAYMVNTFSKPEYTKFKEIFTSYEQEDILGELTINTISLHHFKNMNEWGDPVLTMSL